MNIKRKKNKRVIEGKNLISFFLLLSFLGKRSTAGNGRDATENTRKLEGVFRSEISLMFSGGFQQLSVLSGNHREKSGKFPTRILLPRSRYFPTRILLPRSRYFPCFPVGSSDFPASFLEDPTRSGGRNDRPGLYTEREQINTKETFFEPF